MWSVGGVLSCRVTSSACRCMGPDHTEQTMSWLLERWRELWCRATRLVHRSDDDGSNAQLTQLRKTWPSLPPAVRADTTAMVNSVATHVIELEQMQNDNRG